MLITTNIVASEPASDGSLKQIMQQLSKDYSDLNHAILIEDFDGAASAAHAIAYHDKPSLGQRMKVLSELGSEMSEFKKADDKKRRGPGLEWRISEAGTKAIRKWLTV